MRKWVGLWMRINRLARGAVRFRERYHYRYKLLASVMALVLLITMSAVASVYWIATRQMKTTAYNAADNYLRAVWAEYNGILTNSRRLANLIAAESEMGDAIRNSNTEHLLMQSTHIGEKLDGTLVQFVLPSGEIIGSTPWELPIKTYVLRQIHVADDFIYSTMPVIKVTPVRVNQSLAISAVALVHDSRGVCNGAVVVTQVISVSGNTSNWRNYLLGAQLSYGDCQTLLYLPPLPPIRTTVVAERQRQIELQQYLSNPFVVEQVMGKGKVYYGGLVLHYKDQPTPYRIRLECLRDGTGRPIGMLGGLFPANDEQVMVWDTIRLASFYVCLVLLITIVIASIFSRFLARPVEELEQMTRQVASGEFNLVNRLIDRPDEWGSIGRTLNQLMNGLQKLSVLLAESEGMEAGLFGEVKPLSTAHQGEEDYVPPNQLRQSQSTAMMAVLDRIGSVFNKLEEAENQRRAAELRVLRSQLSPHFLYNALNTVSCMARLNCPEKIPPMISCLVDLLGYGLRATSEWVTLGEEITQLRNFASIEQMRFGGSLRVEFALPSELLGCAMLRLLLQPLVENAFIHGIQPKGAGLVRVTAETDGEDLLLSVSDDGVGLTPDSLERRADSRDSVRIGLNNVNERIRLHFGARYGLKITGAPGLGTCVTVRIPKLPAPKVGGSTLPDPGNLSSPIAD